MALAELFVVGMAYRTLADSRLDGAFVVLAFLAGALALGGVMTAMLLGHWYLNTPTASGKPLEFVTTLMLGALVLEMVFAAARWAQHRPRRPSSDAHHARHAIQTGGGTVIVSTPDAAPGQSGGPARRPSVRADADRARRRWSGSQFIMGFLAPLVLGGAALWLTRGRSFQSATGMLYLCVSFIFIGEILARGLLLFPIFG